MKGKGLFTISLDLRLCKRCGICVALCPEKVLCFNDDKIPVVKDKESCILCRMCEYHCPDFALSVEYGEDG